MATASDLEDALKLLANASTAKAQARFFKTGKGEYGEGDEFLGIKLPPQRRVARQFRDLPLAEVLKVLRSKWHECRLTAVIILVDQYSRGEEKARDKIFNAYLKHRRYLNNWDLIDTSAGIIIGAHLFGRETSLLDELAKSDRWTDRRIAVIATSYFLVRHQFKPTLKLAKTLMADEHDLIHKAVGWMLREIGKRDEDVLRRFLLKQTPRMPRTMLRYAIERFPEADRQMYLLTPREHKGTKISSKNAP